MAINRHYHDDPQYYPDYERIEEQLGMAPGSPVDAIESRLEDIREDHMASIAEGAIYEGDD